MTLPEWLNSDPFVHQILHRLETPCSHRPGKHMVVILK